MLLRAFRLGARGSTWRSPQSKRCVAMASTMANNTGSTVVDGKPVLRGVVFDMDGTLTKPVIDFAEMRRRVGVPPTGDILDVINRWPEEQRKQAYATIAEIEEEALGALELMPGAMELCAYLDAQGLPRGLITRNVRRSVEVFHDHLAKQAGSSNNSDNQQQQQNTDGPASGAANSTAPATAIEPFAPAITRECSFPYKPSPAALQHIVSVWGVSPGQVLMVGDSVKDDIVSGTRAGSRTVLLDYRPGGGAARSPEEFEGEQRPTHVVSSLSELQALLQSAYTLLPPPRNQEAAVTAADVGGGSLARDMAYCVWISGSDDEQE